MELGERESNTQVEKCGQWWWLPLCPPVLGETRLLTSGDVTTMQPLEATFNQIWWQVPLRSIIQLQHSGTPILPPGGSSSCPRSHSPYALHFTWRLFWPERLLSCSSSFIAKPGDYLMCLATSYRPRMVLAHLTIQSSTLLVHPLLPGSYLV